MAHIKQIFSGLLFLIVLQNSFPRDTQVRIFHLLQIKEYGRIIKDFILDDVVGERFVE